ncbi:MAG: RNA-binding cell elongation regulator Jag/EloR [Bacillota bacterium]|uniref:RNA-binding cell elongation regulator Jag/EloR n=1 Tax=unclassified Candidatus Desulforudis TaxID=2635950 RepID=UPI003BDB2779
MRKSLESSGKSVEEAVENALRELSVNREDVEVEVLEESVKGLFGILGTRPARVRVTVKEKLADRVISLLRDITAEMGVHPDFTVEEDDEEIKVTLTGRNMGVLIGRRGETLNSLQYLVSLAANRNQEQRRKIVLDVEGYRRKREETLQNLAVKLADKARRRGRSVVLEPMNPQERRVIHTTLRGRDDIYTFSEGEEPFRKIVIAPRK